MLTLTTLRSKWTSSTLSAIPGAPVMRSWPLLLTLLVALAGCQPESTPVEIRPVRTIVVDPRPLSDDRRAVGEVKPRYESDLSFRVTGKLVARRVDTGAMVKQGDLLASLDVVD